MASPSASAAAPARTRFRPPRRTVRLRLTLLYDGLFLASGIGLLALTYLLAAAKIPLVGRSQHSSPGIGLGGFGLLPGQAQGAISSAQEQVAAQQRACVP